MPTTTTPNPTPTSSDRHLFLSHSSDDEALRLAELVAERLAQLLVERSWNQTQLADSLGLSRSAVNFLIHQNRRSKSLAFYVKLATLEEKTLGEFFCDLELKAALDSPVSAPIAYRDRVQQMWQLHERMQTRLVKLREAMKSQTEQALDFATR